MPSHAHEDVSLPCAAPPLATGIDHFKIGGYAYGLTSGLLTTVADSA